MWDWTNKNSSQGIPYSRYVASWMKTVQKYGINSKHRSLYRHEGLMEEWLMSLGLEKDEAWEIVQMAKEGKLELEDHCEKFIKSKTLEEIYKV